ncbi:hypothetical protein [Oceanobacillus sp. AG]|uniref:hypothetical protein n=1 Tax=Oceanobacillus sp. AG TaxID=2681969 RepID=UPI0012EB3613|nr:hypothetical protein [Oceanobacillus sp. AG]
MHVFRLGPKRYQVNKGWGKLPTSLSYTNISAVTIDHEGKIFVLQRSQPFMLIFNRTGELIDSWTDMDIVDGHYLYTTPDNKVFVVDRDSHRIVFFNHTGEKLDSIGDKRFPGAWRRPFNHPTDIAMTSNGHYYVTDGYGNCCVHHFDSNWQLVNTWGEKGAEAGAFSTPHAIVADSQDHLYITDRENNRIQIFNQQGAFLQEMRNLYHPMDIWFDKEGYIYVTDQTPSLNLFDSKQNLIGRCRTFGIYGHGIAVDENGSIYIAEMFPDSITKLEIISS